MIANDPSICNDPSSWVLPLVRCLPAWFRFAQCLRRYRDTPKRERELFPHLVNAGKYSTTFFVVIFSTFHGIYSDPAHPAYTPILVSYVAMSVVSSLYAYTWDIKMDWGLLDSKSFASENRFLREEIVYSSKGYYYFAILEDFVLRFAWAVKLALTEVTHAHGDLLTSILAPLEVFRRFVWNFFRLENEHLNNCGKIPLLQYSAWSCEAEPVLNSRSVPSRQGHFRRSDRRLRPIPNHPDDG